MADASQTCPRCGTRVDGALTGALCPACLVRLCVEPPPEPDTQGEALDTAFLDHYDIPRPAERGSGRDFGDYELLEEIGRGGMGVVFRARQRSLRRLVALKMILAGPLASRQFVERFRTEAEAAATLDHPHLVPVYEVGEHQGQHFYTMRLVEGRTLAQVLKGGALDPRRAAEWLSTVARAVQHAHQRGVLHRDLKPGNILIDAEGQPQVTDFGLAKLVQGDSRLTLSHAALGTPTYMAPEQAAGRTRQVTVAADVYSLGAILFEALTGRVLFQAESPLQTVLQVCEREPDRPRALNPLVPADLETICLKCLAKEPERRYDSALGLAEDLERWLASCPIQARRVRVAERAWLWCRRKPALAGLAAALAATLVLGSALAGWRIAAARQQERIELYSSGIATADRYVKEGSIDRALETLMKCPPEFRHWEWGHLLFLCHQDLTTINGHTNPLAFVPTSPVHHLVFDASGERLGVLGGDGRLRVWDVWAGRERFARGGTRDEILGMAWHPARPELAALHGDGRIEILDANTGAPLRHLTLPEGTETASRAGSAGVSYDAAGARLVGWLPGRAPAVWDVPSGQCQRRLTNGPPGVRAVWFSADGARLFVEGRLAVRALEAASGAVRAAHAFDAGEIFDAFLDPTGVHVVTIDHTNRVRLWALREGAGDAAGAQPMAELGRIEGVWYANFRQVQFSADGRRLVTLGDRGSARVFELPSARELLVIQDRVLAARFSPDGTRLATMGGERLVRFWDLAGQREVRTLPGHLALPDQAAFSADGRLLASCSQDGVIKIWTADPGREQLRPGSGPCSNAGGYSLDGKQVQASSWLEQLAVWDADSGRPCLVLKSHTHGWANAVFSPDGKQLATVGAEKVARVWDTVTGAQRRVLRGHNGALRSVDWSLNGRWIATGDELGAAKIWDVETGREWQHLGGHRSAVHNVQFDRASARVVTSDYAGPPRVWDVATGKRLLTLEAGAAGTVSAVFRPDGRQVAAASMDGRLRLWDAANGRLLADWRMLGSPADSMDFSPDGRRLAVPVSDNCIVGFEPGKFEIWDVDLGRQMLDIRNHVDAVSRARFSPDGRRLLTLAMDGVVRQQEAFPWREADYGGFEGAELPERIRAFARKYWRARWAAETVATPVTEPRTTDLDQDPSRFPPREVHAGPHLVDLSAHYTSPLDQAHNQVVGVEGAFFVDDNDLRELPVGLVQLGGIELDIRGVIQLRRRDQWSSIHQQVWNALPERVEGLGVGSQVRRVHLLHGVAGAPRLESGTPIASLVWHYANGQTRTVDILYGRDVREWWFGGPGGEQETACDRGRVVWTGNNPVARQFGSTLQLYLTPFGNPCPDLAVTGLDLVSKMTEAGPFVVAVTVER